MDKHRQNDMKRLRKKIQDESAPTPTRLASASVEGLNSSRYGQYLCILITNQMTLIGREYWFFVRTSRDSIGNLQHRNISWHITWRSQNTVNCEKVTFVVSWPYFLQLCSEHGNGNWEFRQYWKANRSGRSIWIFRRLNLLLINNN